MGNNQKKKLAAQKHNEALENAKLQKAEFIQEAEDQGVLVIGGRRSGMTYRKHSLMLAAAMLAYTPPTKLDT